VKFEHVTAKFVIYIFIGMLFKKTLYRRFGLGYSSINFIYKRFGLSDNILTSEVPIHKIRLIEGHLLDDFILDDELKYAVNARIKRYIGNSSYKGRRITNGLPVRGQRTKSNGGTPKRVVNKYKSLSNK
jgi:small subunit ribosomal protein S13